MQDRHMDDADSKKEDLDLSGPEAGPVDPAVVWSTKEERMVRIKLDLFLMPLLVLGFFVLQLDRSNMSNALTDTITTDLHITSDQVGIGNQLMATGIVVAEIPSNLLLQRLGAPVWLTGLLAVWGTISLCQAFVTNLSSFYATRFLLGVFEGGYIPGAQYILALFYRSDELAIRTAVFYFGNYFSTATGSLIAAGLLQLAGRHGLSGWQWLFIIEGAITLLGFLLFLVFMPLSPAHTRPVHGLFDLFTARDRDVMQARIRSDDDRSKAHAKAHIRWPEFRAAIGNHRLWLHGLLNVAALTPKGGLQLYGPTIIRSLGFGTTRANLLNAVSSYLVVVLSLAISIASDWTRQRGLFCVVSFVWSVAFAGALLGVGTPAHADKWTRYALFTLLSAGNALAQGLNDAWLSINATSAAGRSIGLAFVVMGSNIGGIIGPQLFQSSDAPGYVHGFAAVLALYVASMALTGILVLVYWRDNKREQREKGAEARRFQL